VNPCSELSNTIKCKMATFDFNDDNFPKGSELNDRTEWVPLTLTLVEYPKGIIPLKLISNTPHEQN
jgi:hypothetical protein